MNVEELVAKVDKLCDTLMVERRPLLDATEAADLFGVARETFLRRIACRPGFPVPVALTDTDKPNPRWIREELIEWAKGRRMPRRRARAA